MPFYNNPKKVACAWLAGANLFLCLSVVIVMIIDASRQNVERNDKLNDLIKEMIKQGKKKEEADTYFLENPLYLSSAK